MISTFGNTESVQKKKVEHWGTLHGLCGTNDIEHPSKLAICNRGRSAKWSL